ncbi:twin-arginine translocase subunit TatC [Metabacillus sediminilitoris]|uniref:Sec-independent protein translocase protein TatC n=1 Tax=Metabacillus sediminilitoris TaxID=2567941 RepID=A0A4S4BSI2_9BACI|nr:twin-arginine translocase subunit TatC [Metabacillus sediminilitoris]QGQ45682.1 twin-arginine translocase subunit TatC [Metabacillus sediminilitoris]THF77199.1 twin-arginine translocase subunit TatC [Metabacillus sediminilitoris]
MKLEDKKNINTIQHLEELRKRIIITLVTFFLTLILSFVFVQDIYHIIVKDLPFKLALLGPSDILLVYLIIATIVSITATIPVAAHQTWLFVRPALTQKERKITIAYIPALFILFLLGISFGYFILFPLVLNFLMSLSNDMFTTFFTTEKYFRFLLHMTLPMGVLFELPVVIMFLTSLGIIDPYRLQNIRKHAYFVLIVVSILISPPDFLSDILVIIPLLLLYECSVSLSKIVYKKLQRAKENNEEIDSISSSNSHGTTIS